MILNFLCLLGLGDKKWKLRINLGLIKINLKSNLTCNICTGYVQIFGSKIQDFFQIFLQNNDFFFQTQGLNNQIGDQYNRDIKNAGTKLFAWCAVNAQARLNKISPKQKIFLFQLALVVALNTRKKNSRLFTIFPFFISIFQTFFRSGKLLGKFQHFLENSRLRTNPAYTCNLLHNKSNTSFMKYLPQKHHSPSLFSAFQVQTSHKKKEECQI